MVWLAVIGAVLHAASRSFAPAVSSPGHSWAVAPPTTEILKSQKLADKNYLREITIGGLEGACAAKRHQACDSRCLSKARPLQHWEQIASQQRESDFTPWLPFVWIKLPAGVGGSASASAEWTRRRPIGVFTCVTPTRQIKHKAASRCNGFQFNIRWVDTDWAGSISSSNKSAHSF